MHRRRLLKVTSVLGLTALAGCTGDDDEPTQTPDPTPTPVADLTVEQVDVSGPTVQMDSSLDVSISVANNGTGSGIFTTTVSLGETTSDPQSIEVPGDATETLTVSLEPETLGHKPVTVDAVSTEYGEVSVVPVPRAPGELDTDRSVCAHYYPWYGSPGHDWRGGNWSLESPSTPILGDYHSSDEHVIESHIDWCHTAGIDWLSVAWWGRDSIEDHRFKNILLEHPRADEIEWSVLYESVGQLPNFDFDQAGTRHVFVSDLEYLAETYFDHPAYKHIDDRPVIYLYVGRGFHGDIEGAFEEAVDSIGVRPYVIADYSVGQPLDGPPIADIADAVSPYNPYTPDNPSPTDYIDRIAEGYSDWDATESDLDVFPTVIPGFDDTHITHVDRDNPPMEPSPNLYDQACRITDSYADGPVFVTSFNEWYEDTQIEPSEEHGRAYLDITAEVLAGADI